MTAWGTSWTGWHYLAVLAACLLVTLPLELVLGVRVYRRPLRLAATLLTVLTVFGAWDLAAHARGHWRFDDTYTVSVRLAGLPLEEWLFFLVVPACAVLAYEAVAQVLDTAGRRRARGDAAPPDEAVPPDDRTPPGYRTPANDQVRAHHDRDRRRP